MRISARIFATLVATFALLIVAACSLPTNPSTGQLDPMFLAGVQSGAFTAGAACKLLPAADQQAARVMLAGFDATAATALTTLQTSKDVVAGFLWSALNDAINVAQFLFKTNVAADQWLAIAQAALPAAKQGCQAALG